MFFVATAPNAGDGNINLSPKGHDTLRILGPLTLAYLDFGGSGIETVSHIRENGRIVIMMCAFNGQAKIFRFHGTGRVITPADDGFTDMIAKFDTSELGVRSIICVDVNRISDSCGYGVPKMEFTADRNISPNYVRTRGVEKMRDYMAKNSRESIDGLQGLNEEEARSYHPPDDRSTD